MKDRIVDLLGLICLTFILGGLCYFAEVVWVDHYSRTHSTIPAPLPQSTYQLQTPPPMQAWKCDGRIIQAVSNPFPDRCVAFDPKG